VPGAANWRDWWHRAFHDYRRVVVLADGDSAGREMGKRIAQLIDVATVVVMPDGMDCNAVFLQEGPDGIKRRVGV
jgi:DNA primase